MAKRLKLTAADADQWYWKTMRGMIPWDGGEYAAGFHWVKRYHWSEVGEDVQGGKTVLEIGKVYQYSGKLPHRSLSGTSSYQTLWRVTRRQAHIGKADGIDSVNNWLPDEDAYYETTVKGFAGTVGGATSEESEPFVTDLTEEDGKGSRIGVIVYCPVLYLHAHIGAYLPLDSALSQHLSITLRFRVRQRIVDNTWYVQKNMSKQESGLIKTMSAPDDSYTGGYV